MLDSVQVSVEAHEVDLTWRSRRCWDENAGKLERRHIRLSCRWGRAIGVVFLTLDAVSRLLLGSMMSRLDEHCQLYSHGIRMRHVHLKSATMRSSHPTFRASKTPTGGEMSAEDWSYTLGPTVTGSCGVNLSDRPCFAGYAARWMFLRVRVQ